MVGQLLFTHLLSKFEKECAHYLHGCSQLIRLSDQGKLALVVSAGIENTPKHFDLLRKLVSEYLTYEPTEAEFSDMLQKLRYEATETKPIPQKIWSLLISELSGLGAKGIGNRERKTLETLTYEDFKSYRNKLKTGNYVDLFYSGFYPENLARENAKQLQKLVAEFSPAEHRSVQDRFTRVSPGRKSVNVDFIGNGNGFLESYVVPEFGLREKLMLNTIRLYLRGKFFNRLRTEQQLGYAVDVFMSEYRDSLLLNFFIQNYNAELTVLQENARKFIDDSYKELSQLDEKSFASQVAMAVKDLDLEMEESAFVLTDWRQNNLEFNGYEQGQKYSTN